MISIIIPTYNNLKYLILCIDSIKKNSFYKNEILVHINEGSDGTLEYVKKNNLKYTHSKINTGLCVGCNDVAKKSSYNLFLYSHDDMYFCPDWDTVFEEELKKIKDLENFFLSGTMVQPFDSYINLDCGKTIDEFNEQKLLEELPKISFNDFQGTHWQPSLIPIKTWNKVGGFSEEFSPGLGSDPDFNFKLWNIGVRLFKGLANCRVYHFSSLSLRKKTWNNGAKTFLLKWGLSIKFFKKHYLRSDQKFNGLLPEPVKNFSYFYDLLKNKLSLFYHRFINKF